MERLQKKIANNSSFSRRKAEQLILDGNVKVNGVTITELGTKVSDSDEIKINNRVLYKEEKVYYLLNKPKGTVSTRSDEKNRKTVVDVILEKENIKKPNIYPVGRLDYNTTGVLLLTNDGELTNLLTHPRNNVEKTYIAKVQGEQLSKLKIINLKFGIEIDGYKTKPCKVNILKHNFKSNTYIVKLVIHEGKNHQVKKMFQAIGGKVVELKRSEFSFLNTDGLKVGEFRELTFKEVKKLYGETTYEK